LEVAEIKEEEFNLHDQPTAEVPLTQMNGELAALRESVDSLASRVGEIANQLEEVMQQVQHNEALEERVRELVEGLRSEISESVVAELGAKIDALAMEIKPSIEAAHAKNHTQDKMIAKVMTALAAALVVTSGYNLSQENSNALNRALDVFQMFLGAGGIAVAARRQVSRPESMESPEWSAN
jgi:uncharacterized coiled-coil DUF342 family protein